MPENPENVAEVTDDPCCAAQGQEMSDNATEASKPSDTTSISQNYITKQEQTEPQPADCNDSTQNVDSSSTADINQTVDSATLENCEPQVLESDARQQQPDDTAATQIHTEEPVDTAVQEETPDVEADTMDTAEPEEEVASNSVKQEIKSVLEIKVEKMEEASSDKQECQQTRNLFETVGLVLRSNPNQVDNPEKTNEEFVFGGDLSEPTQQNATPVSNDKEPESNIDPSYCRFCGFPAATADIYHKHMKFHDKSTAKYSCYICGFNYKNREIIITHYRKFHGLSEAILKSCENCKFVSSDEQSLTEHFRQHFLIRPYACGVCYMTFVTVQGYNRHMGMKHSKEEQLSVGYIAQNHKRKRGTSGQEGSTISNKRSKVKRNYKSRSISKQSLTDSSYNSHSSKSSGSKSDQSNSNYFVLSTKSLVLVCSFCDILTANKRELTQHLLACHGHELVALKPF